MEWILFIGIIFVIGWISEYFSNKSKTTSHDIPSESSDYKSSYTTSDYISSTNNYMDDDEYDNCTKVYSSSSSSKGGHTYDKWQELGYQVKRGETAAYTHYGKKIFVKNQVVKKAYQNHCWRCGDNISSKYDEKCYVCGMFICSSCGACFCDK